MPEDLERKRQANAAYKRLMREHFLDKLARGRPGPPVEIAVREVLSYLRDLKRAHRFLGDYDTFEEARRAIDRDYYHRSKDLEKRRRRHREKHPKKERPPPPPPKPKRAPMSPEDKVVAKRLRKRFERVMGGNRSDKTAIELLGCTLPEFRRYIEAQFEPGMTWENRSYRGWHIDHKIPIHVFNLADPEEVALCFHYTNLRPLWAGKNFRRGRFTRDDISPRILCAA